MGRPEFATIYGLVDPRTNQIRYIGKANRPKARMATHLREARSRSRPVHNWINKLEREGARPLMVELAMCCHSDWPELEIAVIAQYRQTTELLNVADGGALPFCPTDVRKANGAKCYKSMSASNQIIRTLLIKFGRDAKWLESIGKPEKAAKSRSCQDLIRSMTTNQQDVFAALWLQKGNPVG